MLNIKFPRAVRNEVNALVRDQPGFEAWRLCNGAFDSRNMTKDITLAAIEHFGILNEVMALPGWANVNADIDAEVESKVWLAGQAASGMADSNAMAETVLSPLRPFLSPVLLDAVSKALDPIVAAASKPPVEITKTVTLDASGNQIEVTIDDAKRVGDTTLGKLFGLPRSKHSGKYISLWDATDSPAIDPYFVAEPVILAKLVSAIDPNPALGRKPRWVWLAGPAGSGKTTLPEQVAARAQRPFVRIAFQRAIEPTDLLGMLGLDGKGGMAWRDGMLTKAIRKPGTIILLDEITFAPAGLLAVLQTLLDTRKLLLPTGELVECAEGVTFVAADNTRGYGDETGLYAGTMQANVALVDRMARLVPVDYLPLELESQALANHTQAPKAACVRVVEFVGSARKLPGFDARPLSLRRMVAFVEMVKDDFSVAESFDDCVLTRLPDAERETLRQHFRAAFDAKAFDAEMSGNAAMQAAPASTLPHQIDAQNTFDVIDMD